MRPSAFAAEARPDRRDVLEAVLEREDHRPVERLGSHPIESAAEVVRLHGDHEQRDRRVEPRHGLETLLRRLFALHESQTPLADRVDRALGADAERAGSDGEEAADPTETEHRDPSRHVRAGSTTRFTYRVSE